MRLHYSAKNAIQGYFYQLYFHQFLVVLLDAPYLILQASSTNNSNSVLLMEPGIDNYGTFTSNNLDMNDRVRLGLVLNVRPSAKEKILK